MPLQKGRPVVIKVRESEGRINSVHIDVFNTRSSEHALQAFRLAPRVLSRLVQIRGLRIQLDRRIPERSKESHAVCKVPNIGGERSTRLKHSFHLCDCRTRLTDQIERQIRYDNVKLPSAFGSAPASATTKLAFDVEADARAKETCSWEMAKPHTFRGIVRSRIAAVRTPVPHPTSNHLRRGAGDSQRTNLGRNLRTPTADEFVIRVRAGLTGIGCHLWLRRRSRLNKNHVVHAYVALFMPLSSRSVLPCWHFFL